MDARATRSKAAAVTVDQILRNFDIHPDITLRRPFPEEGLSQMVGRITRFHFAPAERSRQAPPASQPIGPSSRSRVLTPSHTICTPIDSRMKAIRRTNTICPTSPSGRSRRAA